MKVTRRDFCIGASGSVLVPIASPALASWPLTSTPFGAPMRRIGSTTTSSDPTYSQYKSTLVNGLTPSPLSWNGRNWRCAMGSTWHAGMDYALRLTTNKARFEIHNTTYDRPQDDDSTKRRVELSGSWQKPRLSNGVTLWGAVSFNHHHWDDPAGMARLMGGVHGQIHQGSSFGGSPAVGFRRHSNGNFRITTRGENDTAGTLRYDKPLSFDQVHDLVYMLVLHPTNGSLTVWLDRQKIVEVRGVSIGNHYNEAYWNLGVYYGGGISCPVIAEYANHVYPSTASLSGRTKSTPAWPSS